MELEKLNPVLQHSKNGDHAGSLGVGGLLCSYKEQEHAPPIIEQVNELLSSF